jgi:plastocyanin
MSTAPRLRSHPRRLRTIPALAVLALAAVGALASATHAQSVTERPPNLSGTWVGDPGVVHFNFLHRFQVASGGQNKVQNYPTFLLAAGLPARLLAGVRYSTNSTLTPNYPNEWEFFGRWNPIAQTNGAPLDAALHAGYNNSAESVDAELTLARDVGPLRLLAAGRAFSDGFNSGESRYAVAGGVTFDLNGTFTLAVDAASLLDAEEHEDMAWGAALQIAIPYTPHSLSLQATNTNTQTLQGASIGASRTRWGFEFTIPITLSRYFGGGATAAAPSADAAVRVEGDTVRVVMRNLAYQTTQIEVSAGTTVVWVNEDQVQHTVTADDGSFDSGLIDAGTSWSRTFESAGTVAYHCTPHPFMKGVVVVQ